MHVDPSTALPSAQPRLPDVADLVRRWRSTADLRDAELVVRACEPLLVSRVRRLRTPHAEVDDLLQVARMAVWKALRRYVPGPARFTTYAVRTIDGELKRYCRDRTWDLHVPRSGKVRMVRVAAATIDCEASGTEPTVAALVSATGLGPEEVLEGQQAARARVIQRLDGPGGDAGPSIEGQVSRPPAADVDLRMDLRALVGRLPPAQAMAVTCCYYLDMTQKEIAEAMGCSQMQVSRLLHRAREAMAPRITL